ncbi:DUF6746 family protein [Halomonas sp. A29]|uniref:DUF6746 family protein n=1 Tax=Halomonas sp. A29 TaxID=3102786 RepID=UPI00398AAA7F
MKRIAIALLLTSLTLGAAHAAEELEDAGGQPAQDLSQAVDYLEIENDRLDALLQKRELTDDDLAIIEQLSETLANALNTVRSEVDTMSERVQEVRSGAADKDHDRVRENGQDYLERIKTLMQ